MKRNALAGIALLLLWVPAAWSQLQSHPGYADLGFFEQSLGDRITFDADFDQETLATLLAFAQPDDERLGALVENVESVRARVFDLEPGFSGDVNAGLDATAESLKALGWYTLVSVRDDDEERVEVLLRSEEDRIFGLAALFVDGDEAGYANVVGDVTMTQVLSLAPNLSTLRQFLGEMKDRGEVDG